MSLALIGAGIGALKGATVDKWKADRANWLNEMTQRYSPWTGLKAGPMAEYDVLDSAMKYGGAGLSMDQNMAAQAKGKDLLGANDSRRVVGNVNDADIGMDPQVSQPGMFGAPVEIPATRSWMQQRIRGIS